jgi:hypothetical protein
MLAKVYISGWRLWSEVLELKKICYLTQLVLIIIGTAIFSHISI